MTYQNGYSRQDRISAVDHQATIATWDVLRDLGFQPDDTVVYSDVHPGLSFDFGDFKLSASCVTNLSVMEVVLFTGIWATPRTLTMIEFELPRRVISRGQLRAWIVWQLDQYSDQRLFKPARHVGWIEEGRQNRRLLPWVMSQAEFDARPQCTVQRHWLRLARKNLREYLGSLPDNAIVVFTFDGAVFSIRCDTKLIVFPGEGSPWTVCFRVEAKTLRQESKRRIMRQYIGVSIWNSRIEFGPWSYEGTVGLLSGGGFANVQ